MLHGCSPEGAFFMISFIRILLALCMALAATAAVTMAGATQQPGCDDYSTASAAQFALDINPGLAPSLDPDGNGIACDHEGASSTGGPSSGLQLPGSETPTPSTSNIPAEATVDVIDQQPANTTTTTTTQQPSVLDGRLGSTRAAFEAVYGAPVEELPDDANPMVTGRIYAPPPTAVDLFAIFDTDELAIIFIGAETTWDGAGVIEVIDDFLPGDVSELPQPELLDDVTYIMSLHSAELETPAIADLMTRGGLPGEVGDLYIVLYTEDGAGVYDVELGIGNGDNVRESFASTGTGAEPTAAPAQTGQTTTSTGTGAEPTAAPAQQTGQTTTSTGAASSFLADTRTEVDRLQAEIADFRGIIRANTFSDPEIDRLTEIISGWLIIDTALPVAPPEHGAMAQQVQQVRMDVSTLGLDLFLLLGAPESADMSETGALLDRVEASLADLDRQLTALGI
jgi:hypothetical protein